jgi:hypothetical protein
MKILTFKKSEKKSGVEMFSTVQYCIKANLLAQIWNHPRNISRKGECSNADRGDRKPDGIN